MGTFLIMPPYTKPPTSPEDQIRHLKGKGLTIRDQAQAKQVLVTVGYYRLRGFMLSFRDLNAPGKPFLPGVTFEDIAEAAHVYVLFSLLQAVDPNKAAEWINTFKEAMTGLDRMSLEANGFRLDWDSHPLFN